MMLATSQASGTTEQVRNKYNTLTPAEAKKLNKSLLANSLNGITTTPKSSNNNPYLYSTLRHAPIRTASVLHKPRAPPIVVTDLDTTIDQLDGASFSSNYNARQQQQQQQQQVQYFHPALNRSASIRSASLCPTSGGHHDSRRHTVNYGRGASTMASRTSLYSAASSSTNPGQKRSIIHEQQQQQLQTSLNESISNLSFKSSLDMPDCASIYDPCRLQTVSVDLGSHYKANGGRTGNSISESMCRASTISNKQQQQRKYDPMLRGQTIARIKYNTLSNANSKMFSDESYSSTQSGRSSATLRPTSATPTKFNGNNTMATSSHINNATSRPSRSASKSSLSASTYKVFQSPFANFKKLFRNMPHPFSNLNQDTNNHVDDHSMSTLEKHFDVDVKLTDDSYDNSKSTQQFNDKSLGDMSLSSSISQLSLNKSQSPPVCPPPPGELKSMCYMESAINYSNYDEFTRSRNERMAQRQQAVKNGLNSTATSHQSEDQHSVASHDSTDGWQLTSLPVHYERNLTTVYEEKQQATTLSEINSTYGRLNNSINNESHQKQQPPQQQDLIRPPIHFDDSGDMTLTNDDTLTAAGLAQQQQNLGSDGSMQSLNSCTTTSSGHQHHTRHQAPATPFRFSFAQPLGKQQQHHQELSCLEDVSSHKNLGLPPRVPASEITTTPTTRHDNSSSGNSSNCSSQLNGINKCDRPNSIDASDKTSFNSNEDSTTSTSTTNDTGADCANETSGYGNLNGLADNEADITLLSETSTIQGDTGIAYYANRCSELERTVTTLKNKLVSKEKELTDLQLSQLNNDYAIERLKKQVGALERQNAQLKSLVASKGGGGV